MTESPTARGRALSALRRVNCERAFSQRALDEELEEGELDARDCALATELVYGTLTWRRPLDEVLERFVDGGLERLDESVHRILRVGAYQLLMLDRIPARAAVDEAVDAAHRRGQSAASGLINAVLRRVSDLGGEPPWIDDRGGGSTVSRIGRRYSLPNWIANRLVQLYGESRAETLADRLARRPPYFLRIRKRTTTAQMRTLDVDWSRVSGIPRAVRIGSFSGAVRRGLEEGRWGVQDVGSQLVGELVGAAGGDAVLDACAGRGGKTFQLAEQVGASGDVVAVDDESWKLEQLRSRARLLGLAERIELQSADLREFADRCDRSFDRVLVDAPCSGLGTLRRRPEIRWRRDESEVPDLVDRQRELLRAAASLVRPGGQLVYAVCTFTSEEGPKRIRRFLDDSGSGTTGDRSRA
ncbi:MAG: 16S rRNA (cytosine(967)-C(5))-methyltransferase RsmB, partial [Bradymonadaceae bacterium]